MGFVLNKLTGKLVTLHTAAGAFTGKLRAVYTSDDGPGCVELVMDDGDSPRIVNLSHIIVAYPAG